MGLSAETFRNILQSLRSDAACGRNAEQRSEPRVGLRSRVTVLVSRGNSVSKLALRVRDVSQGGIGLISDCAIPEGTALLLHLSGPGASAMICRVVHCDEVGGGLFRIGAHFEQIIEPQSNAAASDQPSAVRSAR